MTTTILRILALQAFLALLLSGCVPEKPADDDTGVGDDDTTDIGDDDDCSCDSSGLRGRGGWLAGLAALALLGAFRRRGR